MDAAQGARTLKLAALVAMVSCVALRGANAQFFQPELRFDAIGPAPLSLEPGIGANAVMGHYVRIGWAAGYDVAPGPGPRWRGELIGRFTFDPFRQQRWGMSIGGGFVYRRSRTSLAVILDLEGPEIRGLLPALQVGASGGLRGGLVLRRAIRGRR